MSFAGKALRALAVAGLCMAGAFAAAAGAAAVDFRDAAPSAEARRIAQWALDGDAAGQPFAVVDKRGAVIYVFSDRGRLLGASAALLGLAPGDHAVPGVGAKPPGAITQHERTTPAGRFASEPGRNLSGEPVVWFDYGEGLAIHRLRPAPAHERRPARLASATPADNRISLGCVVVPVAFFEKVVMPALGQRRGVVYVLPETDAFVDALADAL
jgi:hypothetical protein